MVFAIVFIMLFVSQVTAFAATTSSKTVTSSKATEFNDIMNFLYMGRKEKIREISNESNPYVILNFIS